MLSHSTPRKVWKPVVALFTTVASSIHSLSATGGDKPSSKPTKTSLAAPPVVLHDDHAKNIKEGLTKEQRDEATEHMQHGIALEKTGQYEKAETELKTAIKIRPKLSQAHCTLAESYYSRGRRTEAIDEYTCAINLSPEHGKPYFCRGLIYSDLKDHKSAVADFTKALECSPAKDRIWRARAYSYEKLKMYDKAISDYQKCFELQPKAPNALLSLSDCCVSAGKYDEALKSATQFITIRPQDARGYAARAKIYKKLGKAELAASDLKKASEVGENFEL